MMDIPRAAWRAILGVGLALAVLDAFAGDAAIVIDSDSNMVLLGGHVSPPRPIPNNFAAAGGLIVIDKPVGLNAALAGGSVEVRAPIGGKLAVGGGTVTIDAPVEGTVAVGAGEIRFTKNAKAAGDVHIGASRMDMDGAVGGTLFAVGETLTINGTVQGNVDADVERLVLGPGARIQGNVKYNSDKEIEKSEGATIGGQVVKSTSASAAHDAARSHESGLLAQVLGWVALVLVFFLVLGAGAIFVAMAPIFSVEATDRLRASPGKAVGMGLLTVLLAPMAAVLFMLTVVGIPAGVMILAVYPLVLLLGFVVGVLWLAGWGAQVARQPPPATIAKAIGYFALALIAITLVGKVPVLGAVLTVLLLLMGVGALEVELMHRMHAGSDAMRGRVAVVRP